MLIRSGDTTEVDLDDLIPSHSRYLALLQHSQEIGLRLQADVADFVQENRAALGDFEFTLLAVLRARKRPFLMPKQFAFEQRLWRCSRTFRYPNRAKIRTMAPSKSMLSLALRVCVTRNRRARVGSVSGMLQYRRS